MNTKRDIVIWIIRKLAPAVALGAYQHQIVALAVVALSAVLTVILILLPPGEAPP